MTTEQSQSSRTNRKEPAAKRKSATITKELLEVNPRLDVIAFNVSELDPRLQLIH